jgi:hypothetical protein
MRRWRARKLLFDQWLARHEPRYNAGAVHPSSFYFADDRIIPEADPTDPFNPLHPFAPSSEMPATFGPRSFVLPLPQRLSPRCSATTDEGFILDDTYGGKVQSEWAEGKPRGSIWTGLKVRKDARHAVITYRCESCGYLESYALLT